MPSGSPVGVAAFVGRERERATVAGLVADARVVTVTGPGGCGKTRLAIEVAGDVASRFADGVCWVELQGVRDPGLVAAAVAAAVGVGERPGEALVDALVERLRARRVLVVDNCEHVVEACAELVGALTSAWPRLQVLATSRMPLAVDGEASVAVAGLGVPDPETSSAGGVAVAAAARLFELRARAGGGGVPDRRRQRGGGGGDLPAVGRDAVGARAGGGAGAEVAVHPLTAGFDRFGD